MSLPWVWICLAIIAIVAAFFRFWEIGTHFHFMGDEGQQSEAEWRLIHGHLPLLGPSLSIGGHLGPLFYYLAAVPLWLAGGSPVGPTVLVGLFGVGTIILLFFYLRAPLGDWPALGASAVMAASFLMVEYSRRPWNPTPTPFFTLLFLWSLMLWKRHSPRYVLLTAGTLACLLQLQPVNGFLVAVLIVFLVIARPPMPSWWLIGGAVAIFLVISSPLIVYDATHGMANTRAWIDALTGHGKKGTGGSHISSPRVLFNLFNRAFEPRAIVVSILIALVLCMSGLIVSMTDNDADGANWEMILPLTLFVIALTGFEVYRKEVFEQYMVCLFPVPFIFLAALLRLLWKGIWLRTAAAVVVLGLGAVGIREIVQYTFVTPEVTVASAGATTHDLQTDDTYGHVKAIARQIETWDKHRPFALELTSPFNAVYGYRYVLQRDGYAPGRSRLVYLIVEPPNLPRKAWFPTSLQNLPKHRLHEASIGIASVRELETNTPY